MLKCALDASNFRLQVHTSDSDLIEADDRHHPETVNNEETKWTRSELDSHSSEERIIFA